MLIGSNPLVKTTLPQFVKAFFFYLYKQKIFKVSMQTMQAAISVHTTQLFALQMQSEQIIPKTPNVNAIMKTNNHQSGGRHSAPQHNNIECE